MNNRPIFIIAAIIALTGNAQTPTDKVLFQSDFESANADSVPEELMILAGQFSVKEGGGNKALELPARRLWRALRPSGIRRRRRAGTHSFRKHQATRTPLRRWVGRRCWLQAARRAGTKRPAITEGSASRGVSTFRVGAGHMDIAAPAGPQDVREQMDHRRTSVGGRNSRANRLADILRSLGGPTCGQSLDLGSSLFGQANFVRRSGHYLAATLERPAMSGGLL